MTPDRAPADQILAAVAAQRDARLGQLRDLVAIPSVSADPSRAADVLRAADATRDLLGGAGLDDATLLEVPGGPPAVLATHHHAGPEAPTVLLYAHYDVQPPFDPAAWSSDPFEAVERDGRLHGRGTADDKHGVVSIAWAVAAALDTGALAVNVTVLCEGEEEVGSPHLEAFLDLHGDRLAADLLVIDDGGNDRVGEPTYTASLRGLADWVVTVRAMEGSGQHSGMYGGVVPDPRTALAVLIAGLVDERGDVTIPGVHDGIVVPDALRARFGEHPAAGTAIREQTRVPPDVPLAGDPATTVEEKLWARPSLTVIGVDGPDVASASNTIAPQARAKLSLRLAPGQDPRHVDALVRAHLEAQRPLGLPVTVEPGETGDPFVVEEDHPSFAAVLQAMRTAYGTEPRVAGMGGSIPMIAPLLALSPGAGVAIVGPGDASSNIHGIDESLDLADWQRTTGMLALLLTDAGALRR